MPTVSELTAVYGNFMVSPRPGPGVCARCFNLIKPDNGFMLCYGCEHAHSKLDLIAPISYSIGGEQLHHALASYKRLDGPIAERFTIELAAVLWRHLSEHEGCLIHRAEPSLSDSHPHGFDLVTTVPSSDPLRAENHPLAHMVGHLIGPTQHRYHRLLRRSATPVAPRRYDPNKFTATQCLDGASVLLIDDTWATGANAQSAAAALKQAGARTVVALVIGRHVNRTYGDNNRRLIRDEPFDWSRCVYCSPGSHGPEDRTYEPFLLGSDGRA